MGTGRKSIVSKCSLCRNCFCTTGIFRVLNLRLLLDIHVAGGATCMSNNKRRFNTIQYNTIQYKWIRSFYKNLKMHKNTPNIYGNPFTSNPPNPWWPPCFCYFLDPYCNDSNLCSQPVFSVARDEELPWISAIV